MIWRAYGMGPEVAGRSSMRVLWVVAVLLLLGGAAGAWWLWGGSAITGGDDQQAEMPPTDPPTTGDEDDPLAALLPDALSFEEDTAAARAAAVALAGLTSDEDVEGQLAAGTRGVVDGVDGALPAGTVVTPMEETWARRGNVAAMLVEVQRPGADTPDVFLVWLVRDPEDDDGWLLSSTELLEGPLEEPGGEEPG